MTRIESYPSTSGRSVIRSIEKWAKGLVVLLLLLLDKLGLMVISWIWIVGMFHSLVCNSSQTFKVLATNSAVVSSCTFPILQDVQLFCDHGTFWSHLICYEPFFSLTCVCLPFFIYDQTCIYLKANMPVTYVYPIFMLCFTCVCLKANTFLYLFKPVLWLMNNKEV